MNNQDVVVFCENDKESISQATKEILSKGRQLACQLGVKLIALSIEDLNNNHINQIQLYGADKIIICNVIKKEYDYEFVANAVTNILKKYKPQILLFCSNYKGRALAPWIASKMKTGATADCVDLSIDSKTRKLIQTRPAFGGNIMADIICENSMPQIATIRRGVFSPVITKAMPKQFEVIRVNYEQFSKESIELISSHEILEQDSLLDAKIIFAGGRGIKREGFQLLNRLANIIGDYAIVGGTRAAVDSGYVSYSRQIGQTGLTVKPELYCAFGISGAAEHIAGISNAKKILAVNTDPNAKIFDVADYKIVGDAFVFINKLIERYDKNNAIRSK